MAAPKSPEEWMDRLDELMGAVDQATVNKAMAGNAAAKASIQAWAMEMEAACLYLATYTGVLQSDVEAMIETADTIIDTIQAILLSIGILYLLRRLKKKRNSKGVLQIEVTKDEAVGSAGNRVKPRPSAPDSDAKKDSVFVWQRIQWTTYFVHTVMHGLQMQSSIDVGEGQELVWHCKKDVLTCKICRAMDGEKSVNGDFLPVILKKFPKYKAFVKWMWYPHAHPRCRCWTTEA